MILPSYIHPLTHPEQYRRGSTVRTVGLSHKTCRFQCVTDRRDRNPKGHRRTSKERGRGVPGVVETPSKGVTVGSKAADLCRRSSGPVGRKMGGGLVCPGVRVRVLWLPVVVPGKETRGRLTSEGWVGRG